MRLTFLTTMLFLSLYGCQAQTDKSMEETKNPLLCTPEEGKCELPGTTKAPTAKLVENTPKILTITYFTDPICSSCWGIEPQLRKLKLEYGNSIQINYHMGGLLPDWSYNSGGISKPSDVAHHWDEVSAYYKMPIDGDVWLEDPLDSSYPPSIAFKAAQVQDEQKALQFLRRIREMVFLEKKNITKWEYLSEAASHVGLDTIQLKKDFQGSARTLFQYDLNLGRQLGVRGFPTLFISNQTGEQSLVYGFKSYKVFETSIKKLAPEIEKNSYDSNWEGLFQKYPTLTTREFAELSGQRIERSKVLLQQLQQEQKIDRYTIKNGTLWKRKI